MNTTFSHALRVLVCRACGAAVHVEVEGGNVACDVCGLEMMVPPRAEPSPPASKLTERERWRRLEGQRGRRRFTEEVASLIDDEGAITDDGASAAFERWQQLRDGGEPPFFELTLALVQRLARQGDHLQLRALVETAIEALPDAPRREELASRLARSAALADDSTSASEWLASCDPTPVDLHAHTAFVLASAVVATRLRAPERVLELVGPSAESVVVARWAEAEVSLLRANALELTEGVESASFELADATARLGGTAVDRAFTELDALRLCVRSRGAGEALSVRAPSLERPTPEPVLQRLFPWAAGSVMCLLVGIAIGPETRVVGDHRLDIVFFVFALSAAVPALVMVWRARTP